MLLNKHVIRFSVIFGVLSWVLLLVVDLLILFGAINNISVGFQKEISAILLNLFFLSLYTFYTIKVVKAESINFIDLLWRVFVTGLLATIVSFAIRVFYMLLGDTSLAENVFIVNFFYHVNLGLIASFLLSTFIVWKRLILYQKTKALISRWKYFEYAILASIIFNLFGYNLYEDAPFYITLIILLIMGLVLSVNLKWVAYLNFKQKWKSILLITLTLLYLSYFFINLKSYSTEYSRILVTDLVNNLFVLAVFGFTFLYCIFSLLVILFNLPTSSVFEQKLEDVINFQRLSQSIQKGKTEQQVLEILLDSSSGAVLAEDAWIEIQGRDGKKTLLHSEKLDAEAIDEIKDAVKQTRIKNLLETDIYSIGNTNKLTATLKDTKYKSILLIPLIVQNRQVGIMGLLKDVLDGFNKEMTDIINTFANQACISIENFRLLNEAIENERYKEELKIASKVQKSLLPSSLVCNELFDISGFSESADEVGGDYYDTFQINEHKFVMVIGDVSGKGTSAAFNMSQMKGVFYSLVQLDLSPKDFMVHANAALSKCLEKTSFITLSYFVVDTKTRKIQFSRAGHCPTLFFDKSENQSFFLRNNGLGLGILRNDGYENHIQVNNLEYSCEDIIMLYTDGITEAKNEEGEEFGYNRLKEFLDENSHLDPGLIQENLILTLFDFVGGKSTYDDYTALIIKFK
ncbi:SpoIIE family protein phosphatase [Fulvivirgaceae bacterium BMA10]|uniref:SpoIIE family protein phosphatase n=1 Tax=Splendidivirga corallicola TaxID=3051826 RepID=A0ABT8KTF7_9BACT|nr:SpoIIE family protein phosphatase [Fulvivirgaceae bacterium BMA10]